MLLQAEQAGKLEFHLSYLCMGCVALSFPSIFTHSPFRSSFVGLLSIFLITSAECRRREIERRERERERERETDSCPHQGGGGGRQGDEGARRPEEGRAAGPGVRRRRGRLRTVPGILFLETGGPRGPASLILFSELPLCAFTIRSYLCFLGIRLSFLFLPQEKEVPYSGSRRRS